MDPTDFIGIISEDSKSACYISLWTHVVQDNDANDDIFNLRKKNTALTRDWSKIYCVYHLSKATLALADSV